VALEESLEHLERLYFLLQEEEWTNELKNLKNRQLYVLPMDMTG
jgi:hypothetical protein